MTGLLLTCLLGLSPGVQLADYTSRHVHLVAPLIQLADYESEVQLGRMTREDLLIELNRLEKPSLVVPLVLLGVGGGLGIAGAIMIAVGEAYVVGLGVLLVVGAVVLVIVGGIMLAVRFARRATYNEQVDAVQRRLDALEKTPGGKQEELPPPPPPPPPPPGAGFFVPASQILLAVF